jgi:lipoate-protein ligase A
MGVEAPALALGSSQSEGDVDTALADSRGISVVRRRSGGGAVLLVPGAHVWLDVWLPAGDPLWLDDVSHAADWLADVWVDALGTLGIVGLEAHRGPLESTAWSPYVCFAGLGPGEVTAEGKKLVGISQRRTREWARFQCLVHRRWDADATFGLLTIPGSGTAGVSWRDRVAEIGGRAVVAAVGDALARLR